MPNRPDAVDILSVPVSRVSMSDAVGLLESMVQTGVSHHVVTVNPEFVMTARNNAPFRDVLVNADLAVPDGMGIVLASRILGKPVAHRVTGVDLVERIAERGSRTGIRFFLLGAAPGVAGRAAAVLAGKYSGLEIAGTYSGSPGTSEEDAICRMIAAAHPDVLLVAYGSPAQDLWIARTRDRLNVPVSIGVGGSLDYIAGVVVRAPRWMRNLGLEWLHRLLSQPERWRRMIVLPVFVLLVIGQAVRQKGGRGRDPIPVPGSPAELPS